MFDRVIVFDTHPSCNIQVGVNVKRVSEDMYFTSGGEGTSFRKTNTKYMYSLCILPPQVVRKGVDQLHLGGGDFLHM